MRLISSHAFPLFTALTLSLTFLSPSIKAQVDQESIQQLIDQGNTTQAITEIRKLPMAERFAWLDSLAESRTATGGSSAGFQGAAEGVGGAGGAPNFPALIQLIQDTIAPDDWEGSGSGENTIRAFASGVWIDPKGLIQERKIDPKKKAQAANSSNQTEDLIALPNVGTWQTPSKLRWVSLTKLEQRLKERMDSGKPASASMELVGGLARIDFVTWNPATSEWLLGGPAGGFAVNRNGDLVHTELGLPPVLLEDLLSVAPHILGSKGLLGCSIDPVQERMSDVHQFLSNPSSIKKLSKTPAKFTAELVEKLGPQEVSILGLPKDSPTGLALLVADQHMKRLGLGLEQSVRGLKDYVTHAEKLDAVPGKGLVRWWFAFHDSAVETDEDGLSFGLPKQTVRVLSDKEWMDATGNRSSVVDRDVAADAFAAQFTDRFEDLQRKYPVYGRLRHIFDLTIAMEMIRRSSAANKASQATVAGPMRLDYLSRFELQPHMVAQPEFVPSISTHRVLGNNQTVAIVSGGVTISPEELKAKKSKAFQSPSLDKVYPRDSQLNNWILE